MRLITHNMLKSNIKGVESGYPLGIEVVKMEEQELEFNPGVGLNDRYVQQYCGNLQPDYVRSVACMQRCKGARGLYGTTPFRGVPLFDISGSWTC